MRTYFDSACNEVTVEATSKRQGYDHLYVIRLVNDPSHGYIAVLNGRYQSDGKWFVDSSCVCWFGPGERYSSLEEAAKESQWSYPPSPCECCGEWWAEVNYGEADSSGHSRNHGVCKECKKTCTSDTEGQPVYIG